MRTTSVAPIGQRIIADAVTDSSPGVDRIGLVSTRRAHGNEPTASDRHERARDLSNRRVEASISSRRFRRDRIVAQASTVLAA